MPSSTPASRARAARLNRYLLHGILVGAGVLLGFEVFMLMFKTQCAALVQHAREEVCYYQEQKAHAQISQAYDGLKRQHEKLEALNTELSKSVESAQAQASLEQKQRNLSEQELQLKIKDLQRELQHLTIQSVQKQTEHDRQTLVWQEQLDALRTALNDKDNSGSSTNGSGSSSKADAQVIAAELAHLQARIVQRSHAHLMRTYGGTGTTTVEFQLVNQQQEPLDDVVHIQFSVQGSDMAHTVDTFLTLVSLGLYDGTALFAKNKNAIVGGSPKNAVNMRVESSLTRKYHEHGYHSNAGTLNGSLHQSPLLVEEFSPQFPCRSWAVGLPYDYDGDENDKTEGDNRQWSFVIRQSAGHQDGSLSCPGQITRGKSILEENFGVDAPDDASIYINSARILNGSKLVELENEGTGGDHQGQDIGEEL